MITSYEVGGIFIIEDRGTPTLERMGEAFSALDAKINAIQEKLNTFGRGEGLFSGITAGLEQVNTLFSTLTDRATAAGDAMVSAFRRGAEAATAAVRSIDAVTEAMGRAAEASSRMGGAGAAAGGAGFDEGSYDRPPSGRYPGTSMVPFAEGALAGRLAGPEQRGGMPAPFYGYPASREEEQLRLDGPRFGGFNGYGGAGPNGSGGGIVPPRDENFEGRPSLNLNQGRSRQGGHLAPLVEAGALYEGMKAAAEEEQSIDITLLRGFHIDPRTATDEQKQYLRNLAKSAAEGTSFSEREVAGGEFVLASPMGLSGDAGMRQFGAIFANAAKAAEAAKQLKFGTFEGSLEGTVEFSHQMMQYQPEKLAASTDLLGRIAESVPHGDMAREALIMSYIVPVARGLGADPQEAMTATGFLQRAGLNSTIASTTLRQMLLGQSKTGGPANAHTKAMHQEARELENALGLKPGHLSGEGESEKPHIQALKDLGLMDPKGNYTDLYTFADQAKDPSHVMGGVNINKMFESIAHAREHMDPHKFGTALFNYAGVRGETGGDIISEAMTPDPTTGKSIFGGYGDYLKETKPLPEQLAMIQGNTVQLTGQAVARTADLGNAIGDTFLGTLRAFDAAIIATTGYLHGLVGDHPIATPLAVGAGIGATIYGGWMSARGLLGRVSRFFGEGSAERATAAARGVGPRAGTMLGGVGGIGGLLSDFAGPAVIGEDVLEHLRDTRFTDPKTGEFDIGRLAGIRRQRSPLGGGDPEHHTGIAPAPIIVTVNLGGVTNNGVGDGPTFTSIVNVVIEAVTRGIKSALEHAGSDPHGTTQSPYTYPGGGP